ncbi:MAG: hypothetical protein ACE5MH_11085, partial [Terriglobia bacterium]
MAGWRQVGRNPLETTSGLPIIHRAASDTPKSVPFYPQILLKTQKFQRREIWCGFSLNEHSSILLLGNLAV